jgi:hypothetical protein
MQMRTITLFVIFFLLASSASLGFATLSGIQTASADKNILSASFNNIWEYLPFSLPPVQSPIENINENGDHQIEWSEVSGATRYRLEEENNLAFTSPTLRYTGDAFQTTKSAIVINVPPAAPNLDPIANSDGNGNYQINWNDVVDATSYTLEEDDNIAFDSPESKYSGGNNQANINGQTAGRWYYRVRASNDAAENSAWSNIEFVEVIPDPPLLNTISNPEGDGIYMVDWTDELYATGYQLQEDDNSAFSSPTIYNINTPTSQYDITAQVGGTWYYRVRTNSSGVYSVWSNTQSVYVIPSAPVLSAISNPDGNGEYLVDWSDAVGATSYELQEDDNITFLSPTTRYTGTLSEYSVTGQLAGTWYHRVRASNGGGASAWSNTQSVTVIPVPAAPVLSAISNPDLNGDYLVDWNDVATATGYELQEDDNITFTTPSTRYTGSASQFSITSQAVGTWYYRVRASNAGGPSPWSNTQSVAVVPIAPVLSAISNADGNGDYLVDWSDAVGATGYELQEDDNAAFSSPTTPYTGVISQYSVTGQLAGTWYYRVRANSLSGFSAWSNTQSVIVLPVPAAPVLSAISNPDLNGDYLVDWNDVPTATNYELQEDDNLSFTTPTTRYTGSISQFSITSQAVGTWYYRVRASNGSGISPWSNTQSVSVIPIAPVLSAISNPDGNGEYLVDWNDVVGATGYELQEDDNITFLSPTTPYTGSASQYSVTGQVGGTWYYRVRANSLGGLSAWSNTQSVSVISNTPVISPISNPDGNGDYLVDWSDVVGATGYELQEDDDITFTTPSTRYTGSASQFSITIQAVGTWYYRVRASNSGGPSPWSNTESVVVIKRIFLPLVVIYKPGVHVLPVSYNYSSSSAMYVIGEVINNTQDSITWVKVVVNFYNASNVLVATNNAYLKPRDLSGWEKGCFSISMDIPPSWSYYTFDSPTYSVSATSLGLKIINHSGSYNSTTKDYNIIGQVRNDGNQRSNSVGVSGTVYNSSGVPVGCNYAAVNSTDLEPGQISSFDIKYLSYYRDYIDVTNYKLRVAGDLP